jgi:cytosine/adenosine deaminase-related metal-dependent hydrolase
VFEGDVRVEGGRITALGAGLSPAGAEVIDCAGHLVTPGFVQPHVHLCQTLFRGRADGLDLLDWLRERIWPFEAAHDRRSLALSARLGLAELLLSGTTTILDMGTVHHTEVLFEVAAEMGIRGRFGKAMMDAGAGVPPGLMDSTERALAESCALADRWMGAAEGRLGYAFAPRFVLSCTDGLMREAAAEARRRGALLHTHASENPGEVEAVRAAYGKDNVLVLAELGYAGADVVLAHGVWLSPAERRRLADAGTHLVHCPSANLKLGSGVAAVPELLRAGISVGLASDGAPCNNTLDPFSEMRLAALVQGPRAGVSALSPETVVRMATLGGARVLGLEREIGSLEVGKRADLAVVDAGGLHAAPADDPYSLLVFALRASDVRHVMVDGQLRVRDRTIPGLDPRALAAAARDAARTLVASR